MSVVIAAPGQGAVDKSLGVRHHYPAHNRSQAGRRRAILSPYRVLDLTTERGLLCGQILGDLGADVIKVEPPEGSPARRLGPFYKDKPDPDRSLYWWAYNRNKRGVTLDIDSDDGQAILRRLVEGADFLIESYNPGQMAERGLGYGDLAQINPALVYVSITPFGQDGPKAGYAATDLIVEAAGGNLVLQGDDDRPLDDVSRHTGVQQRLAAAVAALIADHERQRSDRGQHVDVSAQQAVNQAAFSSALTVPLGSEEIRRLSGGLKYGPYLLRWVYPARDGHVAITFFFGSAIGPFTRRLMEWICEEGFCDEATRDKDWVGYAVLLLAGQEPVEEYERIKLVVEEFTKTKTKAELLDAALERSLLIAPVTSIDEVTESEQLSARDYWRDIEHPALGQTLRYPGPFAKFSATPVAYRHRPPSVGEHNHEIYADELGLSEQRLAELQANGVI